MNIKCDVALKNAKSHEVVLNDMSEDAEVIELIKSALGETVYVYTENNDYYIICVCFNEEDRDEVQSKLSQLFGEMEIEEAFELMDDDMM